MKIYDGWNSSDGECDIFDLEPDSEQMPFILHALLPDESVHQHCQY